MLDLGTSILNSVERIPNALAITNKNKTLRYIEWFNEIDRITGSLKDLVLKKGDK
jgi:2-furoate---CoA ligase